MYKYTSTVICDELLHTHLQYLVWCDISCQRCSFIAYQNVIIFYRTMLCMVRSVFLQDVRLSIRHMPVLSKFLNISSDSCLPCAALSWGQPTWQDLGFSGPVHEETHPCGSNFIQSVFEIVQAGCINSALVQTVPSVNDSIWEKVFRNIRVKSWFTNFLTMARKPLSLPSCVNKTLMSVCV